MRYSTKILRSGTGISAPPCLSKLVRMPSGPGKLKSFNDRMALSKFSIVNFSNSAIITRVESRRPEIPGSSY